MKRLTNSVIIGTDKKLGLYFYYSPHFGQNIVRKTTSLTGARVKNDKAFNGFRESGNRMKQASPIAASLYKLIPAEIRKYSFYRLLTGEALKILKADLDIATITERLKCTHIDPLMNVSDEKEISLKKSNTLERDRHEGGLKTFIRYPHIKPRISGRMRRKRYQFPVQNVQMKGQQITPGLSVIQESGIPPQRKPGFSDHIIPEHPLITGQKKYEDLIYLGRLSECKSLKLYVRAPGFPLAGL